MVLRIPHPPLDLLWVVRVLTLWDSTKSSKPEPKDKAGKILPVIITYYVDKSFSFIIKTLSAAVQLKEAHKVKSGSAQPNLKKVVSVTWEQVPAVAEDKMADLNCFTLELAMKLIAGTARSMGIMMQMKCSKRYQQA